MPSLRLVVASLALLVVAGSALSAQKPNFSGFWTLDRAASDITPPAFSGGRGGASIDRLFVTHAANDTLIIGTETNGLKAWSYTPGQEGTIAVLFQDQRLAVGVQQARPAEAAFAPRGRAGRHVRRGHDGGRPLPARAVDEIAQADRVQEREAEPRWSSRHAVAPVATCVAVMMAVAPCPLVP